MLKNPIYRSFMFLLGLGEYKLPRTTIQKNIFTLKNDQQSSLRLHTTVTKSVFMVVPLGLNSKSIF